MLNSNNFRFTVLPLIKMILIISSINSKYFEILLYVF